MGKTKKNRRLRMISRLLFILYMAIALYVLLLSENFDRRAKTEYRYNLVPFQEIERFYHLLGTERHEKAMLNLAGNILCFLPFGLYQALNLERKRYVVAKVTALTLLFSFSVELVQLYFRIGIFDVDDLILNTLGGMTGALLYCFVQLFVKKRRGAPKKQAKQIKQVKNKTQHTKKTQQGKKSKRMQKTNQTKQKK